MSNGRPGLVATDPVGLRPSPIHARKFSCIQIVYIISNDWHNARLSPTMKSEILDYWVLTDAGSIIDVFNHVKGEGMVRFDTPATVSPFTGNPLWGFVVHCACWDILSEVDEDMNEPLYIQALFDLCRSQPNIEGFVEWHHEYADISSPEIMFPGKRYGFTNTIPYDAQDVDPTSGPGLKRLSCLGKYPRTKYQFFYKTIEAIEIASDNHDPFLLLPTELRLKIIMQTETSDITNLRCASKAFTGLKASCLWRSRFLYGHEFSYLYPIIARQTKPRKWKDAYRKASQYHLVRLGNSKKYVDKEFLNRKRVWNLACYLTDLVDLRLTLKRRRPEIQASETGELQQHGDNWLTVQSDLVNFDEKFDHGARLLYNDSITLSDTEIISKVRVSLVSIQDRQYLSGLQLSGHNVGYENPHRCHEATWSGSTKLPGVIRGFYVALDGDALRGIRVYCVPGGFSDWIGDHENLTQQAIIFSTGFLKDINIGLNVRLFCPVFVLTRMAILLISRVHFGAI